MSLKTRRGLATWLIHSQTPLFVLDYRRVLVVFNSGCEQLTLWQAADVIGKACTFQDAPNPDQISSLTGALCPPEEVLPGQPKQRRTLFHRRDGVVLERTIHYFQLESEAGEPPHLLGIITEEEQAPPRKVHPHLEISRHTAALHAKYKIDRLIAASPAMQRVAAQIELARDRPSSVHLIGERGTGREHVARLIHYSGSSLQKRFIPIRCGTASRFELERTLQRLGESGPDSQIGTIYLEEITELPGDLHPLVLSQLNQGNRRWISSSQQGLEGIAEESFSAILAARLTSLVIRLPALRERDVDLPLLAQQLLEECNSTQGIQRTEISSGVMKLFQQYNWPGNVRELAQVISKACERSQTSSLEINDLPMEFAASFESRSIRPAPAIVSLEDQLSHFERSIIQTALEDSRGNKSLAADKLGIPRAKLYRRMESLGLMESEEDSKEEREPDAGTRE